jgi:Ras-related protein Rab-5C
MSYLDKISSPISTRSRVNTDREKIKITIIGDSSVGKSSTVQRLVYNKFNEVTESTIGGAYTSFSKTYKNTKYKFEIWDTAGQERFKSLVPMYLKGSNVVLLVYDVTSNISFDNIVNYWLEYANDTVPDAVKILIGNKVDLAHNRKVNKVETYDFALKNNITYIETSAKNNTNISSLLDMILQASWKSCNKEQRETLSEVITLNPAWYEKVNLRPNCSEYQSCQSN